METPLINSGRFLAGANLWSYGPVLLARFQAGQWNEGRQRQALQTLLSIVPEIERYAVFRRHRTLPAATVALADVLTCHWRKLGAKPSNEEHRWRN